MVENLPLQSGEAQRHTGTKEPATPHRTSVDLFVRVLKHRTGGPALVILLLFVAAGVFAPVIAPFDPNEQRYGSELLDPGWPHIFGTDEFGRDILSRILFGARISLTVSVVAVAIAALIGLSTGLVAGFVGGHIDSVIMRVWDTVLSFPSILIGIVFVAILGPSVMNAAVAVATINIPIFARIVRAATLAEGAKSYVEATRSVGASPFYLMFRSILPNTFPPLLVQITVAGSFAVLLESTLSFLGLGAQPPTPSWGTMLNTGRTYMLDSPWYGIFPGVSIMLLILSLNFVGDALRDVLDPSMRRVG